MGKKTRSAARFKARYGMTLRKAIAKLEAEMRRKYKCPQCESISVKRVSVGVWQCRKCGHTFAGGAYVPFTKVGA